MKEGSPNQNSTNAVGHASMVEVLMKNNIEFSQISGKRFAIVSQIS